MCKKKEEEKRSSQNSQNRSQNSLKMSMVSFTMSDWSKLCSAFNLDLTAVMEVLEGAPVRRSVSRAAPLFDSLTSVSDSESEASAPVGKDNFANRKARAFAMEHDIDIESVTGSSKNGKITTADLKKLLPAKKRGRKPKAVTSAPLDVVDSLAAAAVKPVKPVKPVEAAKAVKGKRVKDPNHPKRASTAWMLFLNGNRASLRAENPETKMTDITKLASVAYKALSGDKRASWDAIATADKERYAKEMETYVAPEPVYLLPKVKKAKSPVKKATNPWMAYLNAMRPVLRKEHPEEKMPAITKLASISYKALTDEERAKWVAIAVADKVRYTEELALHNAKQAAEASKAPDAPKAPKAPKAKKAKKAPAAELIVHDPDGNKVPIEVGELEHAAAANFDDGVDFSMSDSEDEDSDDDELDEDAPTKISWQGSTYWKTWDGNIMEEEDSAMVGRWDNETESIVFLE